LLPGRGLLPLSLHDFGVCQTSGAMPVSRLSLKADLTVIERQSFTAS
jgi:hypothetical protein